MKTKTFTPLEIFLILIFLVLFLSGAGYKFYLSQYQEECLKYKYELINKTKTFCNGWESCLWGKNGKWGCECYEANRWNVTWISQNYTTEIYQDLVKINKCAKYHLVRYAD